MTSKAVSIVMSPLLSSFTRRPRGQLGSSKAAGWAPNRLKLRLSRYSDFNQTCSGDFQLGPTALLSDISDQSDAIDQQTAEIIPAAVSAETTAAAWHKA